MDREGLHLQEDVSTENYDQNTHIASVSASIQRDAEIMFDVTNQQLQKGSEPQNSLEYWNSSKFREDVIKERKREKALLERLTVISSEVDPKGFMAEAESEKLAFDQPSQPDSKDTTLQDLDFSPQVKAHLDEILSGPEDPDEAIARIVEKAIGNSSLSDKPSGDEEDEEEEDYDVNFEREGADVTVLDDESI